MVLRGGVVRKEEGRSTEEGPRGLDWAEDFHGGDRGGGLRMEIADMYNL